MGDGDDGRLDPTPGLSARVLAQVLSMVSEAVAITDAAGVITLWSDAASNMFGYARAEALGQDLVDVFTTTTSRDRALAIIEQVHSGQAWHGELPLLHRDGSIVDALLSVEPLLQPDGTFAGLVGIAQDVSARNQAARDINYRDQIFQALLLGSGDLFAVADADGLIRSIVGPVADTLGIPPEALVGSSIFELVTAGDLERAEHAWMTRVSTTDSMPAEDYWVKRPDDTWCCLNLLANNLLDVAGVEGIVITCRDVTERKQLEQARITLAGTNAALVRATSESDLFGQICTILVQGHTYHLAWIGLADPSRPLGVRMIGLSGSSLAFFEALQHLTGENVYRGPLMTTLETRETTVVQDIAAMDESMPWRRLALDYGYRSMIAVSLPIGADDYGVLAIYSEHPKAFTEDALEVLTDLARDLAHGVSGLRARAERAILKARFDGSVEAAVRAIATAGELRDPYTAGHQRRVAELAVALGTELGLEADVVVGIGIASSIHDIGKLAIPAEILSKPGRLSDNEFALVKEHAQAGHDIVAGIDFPWPVAEMILQHHERLDGSGYPDGLHGEQISLGGRIVAVADVVEAMRSHRPYRPALGLPTALRTLAEGRDTLFDPDVVDACLRVFHEQRFEFTL